MFLCSFGLLLLQLIHLTVILLKSFAVPVPPTSNSQELFFISETEMWNCSFTRVNAAALTQGIFPL